MTLRWILQNWLRNVAQQRVRETVVAAAREQLSQKPGGPESLAPCDVGVVFALGEESGGLEDLLAIETRIAGDGFAVRIGTIQHRRIAIVVSGVGRSAAAKATDALLAGHRPGWIVSAGFCGGLVAEAARHDLIVAERIVDPSGESLDIELARLDRSLYAERPRVRTGTILCADQIVRRPEDRARLGVQYGAIAVDLESAAVARSCRRRGVPFLGIRVVSDAVDDALPREIEHLSRQKSRAGQLGAALGAIVKRPGSIKDFYKLRENAMLASDRLAKYLVEVIASLAPLPPAVV
jgi:adenosylhomocysteine nucleosidase